MKKGQRREVEQRQNAIVGIINLTCYFRRLVTVRECCVISGQRDGLTDKVGQERGGRTKRAAM